MLIVVDHARKVGTLRQLFADDRVVSVDFPLFNRFKRGKSRQKLNVWPELKPVASEISVLQKSAHGTDVLGIFDDTEYGRVQARDLSEALHDLNNQVMFKFVAAYTKEAIDAAQTVTSVSIDCDMRYMLGRLISQQLDEILESYCGADGEVTCSWQQAYLIGEITRMTGTCSILDTCKTPKGIELCGSYSPGSGTTTKAYSATFRPIRRNVLSFAESPETLEDVMPSLDKLRAAGHIAAVESEIPSPLFDDLVDSVLEHADSLDLEGFGATDSAGFFVTDFNKSAASLVESDFTKRIYEAIRKDTLLACCGPVRACAVAACVDGLETLYVHPERKTWLPLSDVPVTTQVPDVDPGSVRRMLRAEAPTDRDLFESALLATFTSRDLWSAVLYLLRKKYVVRRDSRWYLTSRGCLVAHVLEAAFPIALTPGIAPKIREITEFHNRETNNPVNIQQLETLGALVEFIKENRKEVTLDDMWDSFAGKSEVHVSTSAAWVVESEADPSPRGIFYDGNLSEIRIVSVGLEVPDVCSCGASDVVNVSLSPTYETITECPACGATKPLVGIPEKED